MTLNITMETNMRSEPGVCVDCDVPRFVAAVQSGPSHC